MYVYEWISLNGIISMTTCECMNKPTTHTLTQLFIASLCTYISVHVMMCCLYAKAAVSIVGTVCVFELCVL